MNTIDIFTQFTTVQESEAAEELPHFPLPSKKSVQKAGDFLRG